MQIHEFNGLELIQVSDSPHTLETLFLALLFVKLRLEMAILEIDWQILTETEFQKDFLLWLNKAQDVFMT